MNKTRVAKFSMTITYIQFHLYKMGRQAETTRNINTYNPLLQRSYISLPPQISQYENTQLLLLQREGLFAFSGQYQNPNRN
jgi:hypothetical protein